MSATEMELTRELFLLCREVITLPIGGNYGNDLAGFHKDWRAFNQTLSWESSAITASVPAKSH